MMTLHGTTRPQLEALDDDALRIAYAMTWGWRFEVCAPPVTVESPSPLSPLHVFPAREILLNAELENDSFVDRIEGYPMERVLEFLPELPAREEAIERILGWLGQ
jgi:hypothetical protein